MPLARILDGRDDFCAPVGALSGDVARFEQADKTAVVMELRLETLSLIRDLFLCTNGLRQKQFIHLWEKMMDARMGISGWKSACASARMCDSGGQGVDHASASAHPSQDAPGPSHAVSRFNDVRASKVAPEPVASLRDYIDGVKYWKTSAPWTKKDLAEMREHLLTPQFVHENPFPETLGIVANPAELPPFFKVGYPSGRVVLLSHREDRPYGQNVSVSCSLFVDVFRCCTRRWFSTSCGTNTLV